MCVCECVGRKVRQIGEEREREKGRESEREGEGEREGERERGIESRFASEVVARNRSIVNICCELNSKKKIFGQDRLKKNHFLVFFVLSQKFIFGEKSEEKKLVFLF